MTTNVCVVYGNTYHVVHNRPLFKKSNIQSKKEFVQSKIQIWYRRIDLKYMQEKKMSQAFMYVYGKSNIESKI